MACCRARTSFSSAQGVFRRPITPGVLECSFEKSEWDRLSDSGRGLPQSKTFRDYRVAGKSARLRTEPPGRSSDERASVTGDTRAIRPGTGVLRARSMAQEEFGAVDNVKFTFGGIIGASARHKGGHSSGSRASAVRNDHAIITCAPRLHAGEGQGGIGAVREIGKNRCPGFSATGK